MVHGTQPRNEAEVHVRPLGTDAGREDGSGYDSANATIIERLRPPSSGEGRPTEAPGASQAQVVPPGALSLREPVDMPIRIVGEGQIGSWRPGCLPRSRFGSPPRRCGFSAAGMRPGSSSFDGGNDELPELRDNKLFQPGRLRGQLLVELQQIRHEPGPAPSAHR